MAGNSHSPFRTLVVGAFAAIAYFVTASCREVTAFARQVTEFIVSAVAQTFPLHGPTLRGEVALYEVGRSRAVAYADHRRDRFDRRHVDQGCLAAA